MTDTSQTQALIVGGSSGIGYATAKQLLESGIDTVIVGNKRDKLEAAKRDLSAWGNIETLQANVYNTKDVQRIVQFAANHARHLRYFVNAAGSFRPTPFLDHRDEDYDTYLNLNRATFFISQAGSGKHGGQWGWLHCTYWLYVGQAGYQGNPFLGLFNGKGRAACTDSTHGHGVS